MADGTQVLMVMPMSARTHEIVSGRYRGRVDDFEIELRIDIDGSRPTRRVSADYFRAAGHEHRGSMRIDAPTVTASASHVFITGTGVFTWSTAYRQVAVRIPRVAPGKAHPPATLFHAAQDGRRGALYRCEYESPWFRSVTLEEACQRGVKKVEHYETGSLPSAGSARRLTVAGAFAEAGIEMQVGPPTMIDTSAVRADAAWSDAELHAAMEQHFTLWKDDPQWAIWLLHATRHDSDALAGPERGRLQGMMFDRHGAQRQGCAVFYDAMPGSSPASLRSQLYTCVHELAHGFNLPHCWQGLRARPPLPSRPHAASWMNYPERYPGGEESFWPEFAFEFDEHEISHLRHGLRDDVIMGGSPFLSSAAFKRVPQWTQDEHDAGGDGGLRLVLKAARALDYGVPVTVDFELSATTRAGRLVPTVLGPRPGTVELAIRKPDGTTVAFEPLLRHCRGPASRLQSAGERPIRDSAFVHYGRGGYAFSEPGSYRLRARYAAHDGSRVYSDVVPIEIGRPRTATDRRIGELTYGEPQVGVLMSVLGSDAAALAKGNDALREIIERFPRHATAAVARLVLAINEARQFKTVAAAGDVTVRAPDLSRARALIAPILDLDRAEIDISAVLRGARGRGAEATLPPIVTRRGLAGSVDGFIRSRRDEIVVQVPAIAQRGDRPAATRAGAADRRGSRRDDSRRSRRGAPPPARPEQPEPVVDVQGRPEKPEHGTVNVISTRGRRDRPRRNQEK